MSDQYLISQAKALKEKTEKEGEMSMSSLDKFLELLRAKFHMNLFSTIEAELVIGRSRSWTYCMLKALGEVDRIELVQPGSMSRFNIWRVKGK